MGEFVRKINDPLRLRLALSDKNEDRFVRAILRDHTGTPLAASPVDLTHQGNGVYVENSTLMPNADQVEALYCVYKDAGYTELDDTYTSDLDVFDLDTFDPTQLLPKTNAIFATFERKDISARLPLSPQIKGRISSKSIRGTVAKGIVRGKILRKNIRGVVYDN